MDIKGQGFQAIVLKAILKHKSEEYPSFQVTGICNNSSVLVD